MSRPSDAVDEAQRLLGERPDPLTASYAWHALGIVERDAGRGTPAMRHLRRALAAARASHRQDRVADVGASLATALVFAGRHAEADEEFQAALAAADPHQAAQIRVRRGGVLQYVGRLREARIELDAAVVVLHDAGDRDWLLSASLNRGLVHLESGHIAEADRDLSEALVLARADGTQFAAGQALQALAAVAALRGDIDVALRLIDEADEEFRACGAETPETQLEHARVMLAAGLAGEALAASLRAVDLLAGDRAAAARRAQALVWSARAARFAGDDKAAARLAAKARHSFERQGDHDGAASARLIELESRVDDPDDPAPARLRSEAADVAERLRHSYLEEALRASLFAGRLAAAVGDLPRARRLLGRVERRAATGSALMGGQAWLARAAMARARGDHRGVIRAADRGLALLERHALSLGSTELRAQATVHGAELAALAVHSAVEKGDGRALLRTTERWRAVLQTAPRGAPVDDADLLADLTRLRTLDGGDSTEERRRLEERVRRRAMRQPAVRGVAPAAASVEDVVAELGDATTLVSVVGDAGYFHVVVARSGRVQRYTAGPVADVPDLVEHTRFLLRSAARSPTAAAPLLTALEPVLDALQEAVLGPAAGSLRDGPVLLVPPARLQSAPWSALPVLRDRPLWVSPSATSWLRARRTQVPPETAVTLVGGPRIGGGGEVRPLGALYRGSRILEGAGARTDAVLAALEGASLGHIAAHCVARGDNPMLSSIALADGPLTVYDLERLRRPPYRLVLAACDSGVGAPTGANELLGLASSLSALGTAGVLASVVPVADDATTPFSIVVHRGLVRGATLADALLLARQEAEEPMARATAWSFLAFGAA